MTELGRFLIDECIKNKSKSLDLGMCGLTEWPLEVCEMDWLEELNFCNYSYQEPEEGDYSNFGEGKWVQHNDEHRGKQVLIRNHIKELPSRQQLDPMAGLRKLSIGGGHNPIITDMEYWDLVDIQALETLSELIELRVPFTRVSDLSFVSGLSGLESLNLMNTKVSDLSFVSGLSGLQSLDLSFTDVSDLSFVSGLSGLRSLNLWNTNVSDLSFVSGLSGLESLNLSFTDVSDLSFVSGLSGLESLNLGGAIVSDLSFVSGLSGLRSLNLGGANVSDLSFVSGLSGLKSLDLESTGVSDLSFVSGLSGLQSLNLGYTNVSDLSFVSRFSGLQSLNLGGTNVSDLSFVSGLSGLESLNLSFTDVSDLSFVSGLSGLLSLDLSYTNVSDLSFVSGLSGLKSLDLESAGVSDLSFVSGLSGLKSLNLGGANVSDVSFVSGLSGLESLNLGGANVSDLSFVSGLSGLLSLDLSYTNVSDLSFVSGLSGLLSLDLSYTNVSDVSFVSGLSGLQSLNLSDTKVSDLKDILRLLGLPYAHISMRNYGPGILLGGAPLKEPPPERVEKGIASVLSYFEEKHASEKVDLPDIINEEAKLVILGNSTVGKSSLLKYLGTPPKKRKDIDFDEVQSTHGLQQITWKPRFDVIKDGKELKNITLTVLDFGGQEYYHDCHHLFFTNRTAYMVLWDEKHNHNETVLTSQKLENGEEVHRMIEHHSLEYWLDAIAFFVRKNFISKIDNMSALVAIGAIGLALGVLAGKRTKRGDDEPDVESSETEDLELEFNKSFLERINALIVQNKIGKDRKRIFLNRPALLHKFPFIQDFAHIDIHEGIAMEHLEMFQLKELVENLTVIGEVLPGSYGPVDKVIKGLKARSISKKEFEERYSKALQKHQELLEHKSFETWRANYLQHKIDTGKWLHYTDTEDPKLKDQIFIKPFEIIEMFYAILNDSLKEDDGQFKRADAIGRVKAAYYSKQPKAKEEGIAIEVDEILALMCHFHIIFEMEAEENFFVAPQYLPAQPHKSVNFLRELLHKGTHRYAYEGFIHKSVVLEFFSAYGQYVQTNKEGSGNMGDYFFWKDGIVIKKYQQVVMVEFDQKELKTYIKSQDHNPEGRLVEEIIENFDRIHQGRKVSKEVSVDGQTFVDLEVLNQCVKKEIPVLEFSGKVHRVADYRDFIDKEYRENYPRMKVFISYSKSDIAYIEELRSHLKPLVRQGKIEPWYDRDIHAGAEWDQEIKKNLKESKIILMMVSSDFINTDYIWHEEIPAALRQHENKESTVIPIILRDCLWEGTPLAKLNSPRKGKPIKGAEDRDVAWTEVVKAIQRVVEGKEVNPSVKTSE